MLPNKSGIYLITNKINGLIYVGSSKDIKWRWSNHKSYLKRNKHKNKKLQNAWNKYGSESLECTVLELVENKEELPNIEQKWIDNLDATNRKKGYNILPIAYRQFRILGDCIICQKQNVKRTRGRCHNCNMYLMKYGKERPYKVNGKKEKREKHKEKNCLKCNRSFQVVSMRQKDYATVVIDGEIKYQQRINGTIINAFNAD